MTGTTRLKLVCNDQRELHALTRLLRTVVSGSHVHWTPPQLATVLLGAWNVSLDHERHDFGARVDTAAAKVLESLGPIDTRGFQQLFTGFALGRLKLHKAPTRKLRSITVADTPDGLTATEVTAIAYERA